MRTRPETKHQVLYESHRKRMESNLILIDLSYQTLEAAAAHMLRSSAAFARPPGEHPGCDLLNTLIEQKAHAPTPL